MAKFPAFFKKSKQLFDAETLKWLLDEPKKGCGKELFEEANAILNDGKEYSRKRVVRMYVVAKKNWLITQGLLTAKEKEAERLETQIKILKRGD